MADPSAFTVAALKKVLRDRQLPTTGSKNKLIARLREADPEGTWLQEEHGSEAGHTNEADNTIQSVPSVYQREAELYKREKELAERELALMRQELNMLRGGSGASREKERRGFVSDDGATSTEVHSRRPYVNVTAVAKLLMQFDGKSGDYDTWERQVKFLKTSYQLNDDVTKVMIGMRLKDRVLK